jgi:hypothetical protein
MIRGTLPVALFRGSMGPPYHRVTLTSQSFLRLFGAPFFLVWVGWVEGDRLEDTYASGQVRLGTWHDDSLYAHRKEGTCTMPVPWHASYR